MREDSCSQNKIMTKVKMNCDLESRLRDKMLEEMYYQASLDN